VEISRVSELVEIQNARGFLRDPLQDKIRPNEAGTAGDENQIFHARMLAA
jgi:hypothetical protein